jgi:predicted metal-dependent phosphoesterase TrpH
LQPLISGLTLAAAAPIDLQLHTTFSDGTWTAEQLIDHLVAEGFALAAITDHDRTDTTSHVQQLAAARGLPLLAAAEMSSTWNGDWTDVLCYGFDPDQNELQALGEEIVRGQRENTAAVYAELLRQGYQFPHQAAVLAKSNGEVRAFFDIAELLHEHGYAPDGDARTIMDAAGFVWFTGDLAAVVEAAHRSGAVCLLSHPGRGDGFTTFDRDMLDDLRRTIPIDGLEVRHPSHTPQQCADFLGYVETHGLLASTGSDSHGPAGQLPIKYPAEISRRLLERLGIRVEG